MFFSFYLHLENPKRHSQQLRNSNANLSVAQVAGHLHNHIYKVPGLLDRDLDSISIWYI